MLNDLEVARFHGFGFHRIMGCLRAREVAALEQSYERLMCDASVNTQFGENGSRYRSNTEAVDPNIAALVVHSRVVDAMRDIWGTPCLYFASGMWGNKDDTPWHTDHQPGCRLQSIKVTYYLDEMTEEQGAIRLLPGTHHRHWNETLFATCGYWDKGRPRLKLDSDSIPGVVVVHTVPGDVLIWDNRLWHAAPQRLDGRTRRALFLNYYPDPRGDELAVELMRRELRDHIRSEGPTLYAPCFLESGDLIWRHMAERLEALGVDNVRS